MRIFVPHTVDARTLSQEGEELWAPTLVGRKTMVSNLGRLHTPDRGAWLPEPNRQTGYRQAYIRGHGKAYLHWLAIASFEGVLGKRVRRHNGDKADNRLCNLYWSQT